MFGAAFHIAHWHIGEDCASSLHPVVNAGEAVKTKKAPFSLRAPCKPPGLASVVFDQAPVLGVMIWFLDRFYKPIVCQSAGRGTNGEAGTEGTNRTLSCLHEVQLRQFYVSPCHESRLEVEQATEENRPGAVNSNVTHSRSHDSGCFGPISGFMQRTLPLPHIQTSIVTKIPNNF